MVTISCSVTYVSGTRTRDAGVIVAHIFSDKNTGGIKKTKKIDLPVDNSISRRDS
ncbi:MAG: hypothetical protein NG784_15385 [Candidatus Jettenia sp.]|nr:hypothetical protein [Candidatus Jettenia sp.]